MALTPEAVYSYSVLVDREGVCVCTCVNFGKGCLFLVLHSGVLWCSVCAQTWYLLKSSSFKYSHCWKKKKIKETLEGNATLFPQRSQKEL